MSPLRILSLPEINHVVVTLHRLRRRSKNAAVNLILFRLASCCGLRVCELTGLRVSDVRISSARPHIHVPAAIAKGGKARNVPLWWDAGTLADLEAWKTKRLEEGATGDSPFLTSTGLKIRAAQLRWETTIRRTLGPERSEMLSIHDGRHTFCSQALAGGRSLAEVRDAAGHSNVSTTNTYLHCGADDGKVGELFAVEAVGGVA